MRTEAASTAGRSDRASAGWLLTPAAIRERCHAVLAAAQAGALTHFALERSASAAAARFVAEEIRRNYPGLAVPYHSRWRHFGAGGADRWAALAGHLDAAAGAGSPERVRLRFDLAITSVLLDAGAGPHWHYREPGGGRVFARSEGLAVASFDLFAAGAFASDPKAAPLRADAAALERFETGTLAEAFQVGPDNPLEGLDGRAGLLRRLGAALTAAPELFGAEAPRIGNLADYLIGRARDSRLPAPEILAAVLRGLGPIWPGRIALAGIALGDVWRHSAVRCEDASDGLVPFHKLSQWLTYSLVEPLEEAGVTVTELDRLTGLAEYRNGGLFVDLGVLRPKHDAVTAECHGPGDEVIVEWRALTLALLDELAAPVRAELGMAAADFPLARILEGGTWSAGRRIAAELRPGGPPPIRIDSDGTVF